MVSCLVLSCFGIVLPYFLIALSFFASVLSFFCDCPVLSRFVFVLFCLGCFVLFYVSVIALFDFLVALWLSCLVVVSPCFTWSCLVSVVLSCLVFFLSISYPVFVFGGGAYCSCFPLGLFASSSLVFSCRCLVFSFAFAWSSKNESALEYYISYDVNVRRKGVNRAEP